MKNALPRNEILTRNPARKVSDDADRLFVGSLEKAVQVLYAFGGNEPALTSTEIARMTGLNISAVQRFTHTLHRLGLLEKDLRTKQFRLSVRLLDFAYLFLRSDALSNVAYPHLLTLSRETGEFVNLSVLDRADVIYIMRLAGARGREHRDLVGGRMPSFCTSNGRIMLAYLPEETAVDILASADRRPLTADTLTDPTAIVDRIREARATGYCIVENESEAGVTSVAAPIFAQNGEAAAAISIAVMQSAWPKAKVLEDLVPAIVETSRVITQAFTGTESLSRL